jgi:hypothetical protein
MYVDFSSLQHTMVSVVWKRGDALRHALRSVTNHHNALEATKSVYVLPQIPPHHMI